jgi:hypothetical protein
MCAARPGRLGQPPHRALTVHHEETRAARTTRPWTSRPGAQGFKKTLIGIQPEAPDQRKSARYLVPGEAN